MLEGMSQGHAVSFGKKNKKVSWNMICLKYRTLKKCLRFHSIFHSNDVDSGWWESLSGRRTKSPVEQDALMLPPKSVVGSSNPALWQRFFPHHTASQPKKSHQIIEIEYISSCLYSFCTIIQLIYLSGSLRVDLLHRVGRLWMFWLNVSVICFQR